MANPNEYIVFEADQVLTNDHLNETFNYLDQQNRWTRNKLIGIGIVCGLNIVQQTGVIQITKGVGVTSQGYLILLDTSNYAYYIPYDAPDQPADLPFIYPGDLPFYKQFNQSKKIFLFLTDDEYNVLEPDKQKDALTLSSSPQNFLNDFAVVLFLEANELDLKNCDMFDCNNKGEKMSFKVRPLLVGKRDLPKALRTNSNNDDTSSKIPHQINFKRFNVPNTNPKTSDDILNAIASLVDDTTLTSVANAYIYCYEKYKAVLSISVNPFTDLFNQLKNRRDAILKSNKVFIQYFYDFIDDLIKAYYEFSIRISQIISACCPEENLFPLHLVLGEASENTNAYVQDGYRQYFIYSPLFDKSQGYTSEAVFLFQRMQLMVKEFIALPRGSFANAPIKIMPSGYQFQLLSQRAIPYYYKVNETGNELYKAWSYYKTVHNNAAYNLGYNANQYNQNPAVVNPLLFDIEHYNFFRIEGHIGKNYNEALSNIVSQIQTFNLPFDVVAIQAGGDATTISADTTKCSFQDLNSSFAVIRSRLFCLLGKLMCYAARQTFAPPVILTDVPVGIFNNLDALKTAANIFNKSQKSTEVPGTTEENVAFSSSALKGARLSDTFRSPFLNDLFLQVFKIYFKGTFLREQPCFKTLPENSAGKYYDTHIPSGAYIYSAFDPANLSYNFLSIVDLIEEVISTVYFATLSSFDITSFTQKFSALQDYLNRLNDVFLQFEINQKKDNLFTDFEENMDLFDEVIYSCFSNEFSSLKDEYNSRLAKLKEHFLFSNYLAQHRGMEHKAGVNVGGTFIIVYNPPAPRQQTPPSAVGGSRLRNILTADASIANDTSVREEKFSTSELKQRLQTSFGDVIANEPEFINRAIEVLQPQLSAIVIPPQFFDYEVIADFFVPYKCCSDCAPVAYVLPEKETPPPPQKPVLRMETSFCDDDKTEHQITASPEGGTFADANGNKIKGIDEATHTFVPAAAGAGSYTVIYTVEGVPSDTVTITVFKKPSRSEFKFESTPKEDRTFEVRFFPALQDEGLTCQWKFGPGFSTDRSEDKSPVIVATMGPAGGETKTFASLVISNGGCAAPEVRKDLMISPNGVFQLPEANPAGPNVIRRASSTKTANEVTKNAPSKNASKKDVKKRPDK